MRGLKKCPAEVSVIVTVTDDGGSSGRLREELGVLPPGDIRNCLLALSEDENLMAQLFRFRFNSDGGLHNHSFGNLFLTAMAGITGDFAKAVRLTSEVLAINGVIYPSTNSNVRLRAEFHDGTSIVGETRITAARRRIRRIELEPPDARPLPDALCAISRADVITLGPGSLYTSLIPNLLVTEVAAAINASRAKKIYIQNVMTQPGETEGYGLADHVQALADHCCGAILFPNVLMNSQAPSSDILKRYEADHAHFIDVQQDDRCVQMGIQVVARDLLAEDGVIRHDPDRLAYAILELAEAEAAQ